MSDIYLSLTETPTVVTLSQPVIASSVAATVTVGNTVTVALDANSLSALENVTVTVGAAVSVSNFPSTQTVAGTVTANAFGSNQAGTLLRIPVAEAGDAQAETGVPIAANIGGGPQVVGDSYPLPISGTVTANVVGWDGGNAEPFRIGGYSVGSGDATRLALEVTGIDGNPLPISGTVTANNPNGALTTRFGSVTTANTAQITSAVTNLSRKYLLAQNISAGTVTIGIGFSPTTTQGIQLTAGAGLTFDSFCPTGAVYWLGAVTGAAFTILEG